MWDEEVIPQQLKDASIIHLYNKGNRQRCDNYRRISLLAIAGKILARVMFNRLIVHSEHVLLPESQCCFRGGRGTVDMILAVVLIVLLYACESWTVYIRHARKINHFHTKCLRIILSIKWQDMVPDTEVLTRAGIPSIHTLLQKAHVRWAGRVTRMTDDRLPKQLLYGELCHGKRSVGGQKKRFKDILKKTLTSFNINVANWEVCAQDRPPVAQYDSYWSKNSRNKQDRGGSEKARCSQSETLLYHQCLSRPDIPMLRVWKSAAGQNWTD